MDALVERRFGRFVIQPERRQLLIDGQPVKIGARAFDILIALVERRHRVATKDELLDLVWLGNAIEESNLAVHIAALRKLLGAGAIVTIPGRGYQFAVPFDHVKIGTKMPASERWEPPRLSMVVLPFANIGGDPQQEHFVDGVTESLTTDLSRISGAFVIGRSTAFTYKGKTADVKRIGRELNVRSVLEGSVQRSGDRMRVNVQLIDAESENHLWAERFDKPIADLFDMQDEIVARLAGALHAQLVKAEARRSERAAHPDSTDLYFQGLAWFNKGMTPDNIGRARCMFDGALIADPDNADALVVSAHADAVAGVQFLVTDPAVAFFSAETKLIKALSIVPDRPQGHMTLGFVYMSTKRATRGIAECEHALALDRNLASAHAFIGMGKVLIGRAEETEAHVGEAFRLSPRDTLEGLWMAGLPE
jgi:TolB-like protein